MAKEAAEELGILNIGIAGYEADDCIGTLSAMFSEEAEITIVTGDKDLLQLLTVNVKVALLQKGIGNYKVYTEESFSEETGVEPKARIDITRVVIACITHQRFDVNQSLRLDTGLFTE